MSRRTRDIPIGKDLCFADVWIKLCLHLLVGDVAAPGDKIVDCFLRAKGIIDFDRQAVFLGNALSLGQGYGCLLGENCAIVGVARDWPTDEVVAIGVAQLNEN